jgi:hypothetical protein
MFWNPRVTYEEYMSDSEEPWIYARDMIKELKSNPHPDLESMRKIYAKRQEVVRVGLVLGLERACVLGFPDLICFYVREIERIPGVTALLACAVRSILARHF